LKNKSQAKGQKTGVDTKRYNNLLEKYGSKLQDEDNDASLDEKLNMDEAYRLSTKKLEENLEMLMNKQKSAEKIVTKPVRQLFVYKKPSSETTQPPSANGLSTPNSSSINNKNISIDLSNAIASSTPEPPKLTIKSTPPAPSYLSEDEFDFLVKSKQKTSVPSKVETKIQRSPVRNGNQTRISDVCNESKSLSPEQESNFSLRFDDNLNDDLIKVFNSSSFKSKDYSDNENINYLQVTHNELHKKYFGIMNQIPIDLLKTIPGFNAALYMKLKSLIQTIQVKLNSAEKVNPDVAKTHSDLSKRKNRITNSSFASTSSTNEYLEHIEIPETEEICGDYLPSNTFKTPKPPFAQSVRVESPKSSTSTSTFTFKKPTSGLPQGPIEIFDHAPVTVIDDDDFDADEILQNVIDAELESQGRLSKYNNISEIDLITPDTSLRNKSCEPRINFQKKPATVTRYDSGGTQFIEDVETQAVEIDDDGWQVFDFDSFKENDTSNAGTSNVIKNTGFQTAREVRQKDIAASNFLDMAIPTPGEKVFIKPSSDMGKFHAGVRNDGITGTYRCELNLKLNI
jgi:hypothetical protein